MNDFWNWIYKALPVIKAGLTASHSLFDLVPLVRELLCLLPNLTEAVLFNRQAITLDGVLHISSPAHSHS